MHVAEQSVEGGCSSAPAQQIICGHEDDHALIFLSMSEEGLFARHILESKICEDGTKHCAPILSSRLRPLDAVARLQHTLPLSAPFQRNVGATPLEPLQMVRRQCDMHPFLRWKDSVLEGVGDIKDSTDEVP